MNTVISTDVFATQTITGKGDTLTVNQDAAIITSSSDTAIVATGNVDNRFITVDGGVVGKDCGIDIQSSTAKYGDVILVGKSGYVTGSDDSVRMQVDNAQLVNNGVLDGRVVLSGYGGTVTNRGTIIDESAGVVLLGTSTSLTNSGMVNGWYNVGVNISGENAEIRNSGTITGRHYGIDVDTLNSSGNFKITNSGLIRGTDAAINLDSIEGISTVLYNSGTMDGKIILDEGNDLVANSGKMNWGFNLGYGDDRLVNTGTIKGMATMNDGNDTLNAVKGKITGASIGGGDGDDTFIVARQENGITENLNEGYDTISSSGSFTLAANFEKLQLFGTSNINGTGNGGANDLFGNKGANHLNGMAGSDHLTGGRGTDILTGGADADTFVFAKGFGHDTVTDFENGADTFDLTSWDEIANYTDLKLNHVSAVGNDIVITAGTDSLTIKDTDIKELNATDFQF